MSFVISIDKFTGSCNVLSPKIYAQKKKKKKKKTNILKHLKKKKKKKKKKDKYIKTFNLIANKNGPKIMTKYISCNCR